MAFKCQFLDEKLFYKVSVYNTLRNTYNHKYNILLLEMIQNFEGKYFRSYMEAFVVLLYLYIFHKTGNIYPIITKRGRHSKTTYSVEIRTIWIP